MARRHHRTVVKREHPHGRWLLWLSTTVLALLIGWGSYELGFRAASERGVPLVDPSDGLKAQLAELETRAELDREAIARLTTDLAESRASLDELEGELNFYREVMAPEESDGPVRLRPPRFSPTDDPRVWEYQIIVQQSDPSSARNAGDLRLRLFGVMAGETVELNLVDLDADLEADALGINFRYFQRFDGVIRLPPGFVPERVEIEVVIAKPRPDGVLAAHDWNDVIVYTP
ncbi:MAG: hypothetical protein PVJ95_04990 [Cellvibrionales bacterium]|jgi:hypothetical protein